MKISGNEIINYTGKGPVYYIEAGKIVEASISAARELDRGIGPTRVFYDTWAEADERLYARDMERAARRRERRQARRERLQAERERLQAERERLQAEYERQDNCPVCKAWLAGETVNPPMKFISHEEYECAMCGAVHFVMDYDD